MSGVFAEACGEDEASDYSHIYYSLFLRALESGVSRRDLLSIGPREGRWGGATIVCSIAELTECALLERSSDPPAHLSLIHGGAE
jgi:hypothetical protein